MSYADDQTDAKLLKLEKKISKEYTKAYKEMQATSDEYFSKLKDRYAKEYKAFQEGKYTEAEFKAWYQTQIERGNGYKKMCNELADRMTNANVVASAYINDSTPTIYSLNANHTAYQIEQVLNANGVQADFQLVNEQAIKNLMENEENVTEFKTAKVNTKRDYEWNSDQIRSAMISGIAQGKSIDQLSTSFLDVMKRNRSSAIRNARTSYTSAQNAGRNMIAKKAQEMGINVRKQWHSMEDGNVRYSHARLNGQIRDMDKRFDNGLMYPADSQGRPEEVYNCRCRMEYILPDYMDDQSIENFTNDGNTGESYQQWLKRKQKEAKGISEPQKKTYKQASFTPAKTIQEAEEYATRFAENVSYNGMSINNANVVNQRLTELTEKYPLKQKLTKIETSKRGNFVAKANFEELIINPTKLGKVTSESEANFVAQKQRAIESIQILKDRFANKAFIPHDIQENIKKLEQMLKYDRYSTINDATEVISHEFGHIIADQYIGQICGNMATANYYDQDMGKKRSHIEQALEKARKDGYIYKLGKYGNTNKLEFFAESFNAREKGEDLPDYILEMLTEVTGK